MDIGLGVKPAGYYIQRSSGLFPIPVSQDCPELEQLCQLFGLLGLFLAKCIQDGRRVDIPLAPAFFKLMCQAGEREMRGAGMWRSLSLDSSGSLDDAEETRQSSDSVPQDSNRTPVADDQDKGSLVRDSRGGATTVKERRILEESSVEEEVTKDGSKEELHSTIPPSLPEETQTAMGREPMSLVPPPSSPHALPRAPAWFSGVLDSQDLLEVDPYRGTFLRDLRAMLGKRDTILADTTLTVEEKSERVAALTLGNEEGGARVEDLL